MNSDQIKSDISNNRDELNYSTLTDRILNDH